MALNFQQRGSVLARRALLAALLVASVAMVAVYSREGEGGPLHAVQGAVSGAVAQVGFAGAAAGAAGESAAAGVGDLVADEGTLSGLREYNAELVEQYSQMEEYRQENERLRALLDLKDAYDVEGVGARVIGRSSEAWNQTVTIDKGTADGVDTGLTVTAASGVVGQVVSPVSEHTATVRLLTDPQSGAAAMVQSSRAEGIVRGSLEGLLYLEYLDADAQVAVGDVVVTSGMGGSYAKGLLVGTVVKVDAQQGDSSRRAVVAPNDTASLLEEVLVVSGGATGGSPEGLSDEDAAASSGGLDDSAGQGEDGAQGGDAS